MIKQAREKGLVISLLIACLAGCDDSVPSDTTALADSRCNGTMAQISVQDGFLRRLCGCDETSTDPVTPPAVLTCTVPAGTTVFFQYAGTHLFHEIVPNGTPTFPPSPVYDPSSNTSVSSHPVRVDSVGTYLFVDAYDGSLNGQIIAR